jgi:hypothetical protein
MNPTLSVPDARLNRCFHTTATKYASVNEYSGATGLSFEEVMHLLSDAVERQDLALEPVGGEVFVHTAPVGRPTPSTHQQVPPNLWELLREGHEPEEAFVLWRLVRDLEAATWDVEPDLRRLPRVGGEVPLLGLNFSTSVVPLLIMPNEGLLASQSGPLTLYNRHGFGLCAVTCRHGELDTSATAVRNWMLQRPTRATLDVILLEAPRYQPVLLTADDGGVSPVNVSVSELL